MGSDWCPTLAGQGVHELADAPIRSRVRFADWQAGPRGGDFALFTLTSRQLELREVH
jgi:hypothetical protein